MSSAWASAAIPSADRTVPRSDRNRYPQISPENAPTPTAACGDGASLNALAQPKCQYAPMTFCAQCLDSSFVVCIGLTPR